MRRTLTLAATTLALFGATTATAEAHRTVSSYVASLIAIDKARYDCGVAVDWRCWEYPFGLRYWPAPIGEHSWETYVGYEERRTTSQTFRYCHTRVRVEHSSGIRYGKSCFGNTLEAYAAMLRIGAGYYVTGK